MMFTVQRVLNFLQLQYQVPQPITINYLWWYIFISDMVGDLMDRLVLRLCDEKFIMYRQTALLPYSPIQITYRAWAPENREVIIGNVIYFFIPPPQLNW